MLVGRTRTFQLFLAELELDSTRLTLIFVPGHFSSKITDLLESNSQLADCPIPTLVMQVSVEVLLNVNST